MIAAGGTIGILAGFFGLIAAYATLFLGGVGEAFHINVAQILLNQGWADLITSFLLSMFGVAAAARVRGAGIGLILIALVGMALSGSLIAICMGLGLLGGILTVIGVRETRKPVYTSAKELKEAEIAREEYEVRVWALLLCISVAFAIHVGNKLYVP